MYDKFLTLEKDKQSRILKAALSEFSRYGYKKTSVEQIAVAADISKSMVFHYFKNKIGLYEFLLDYTVDYIVDLYSDLPKDIEELDYIGQYQLAAKVKLEAFIKNREIFDFLAMLYLSSENAEVSKKAKEKIKFLFDYRNSMLGKIFNQKNYKAFKDDIDVDLAKRFISWTIEGYSNELTQRLMGEKIADMDFGEDWDDYDRILVYLKKLFYKEEYQ